MDRKYIKKIICSALVMAITTLTFSTTYSIEKVSPDLTSIAENTIQISSKKQKNGLEIITYENLPLFVEAVHKKCPNVADEQLADFIVNYTDRDVDAIPVEDKLEMLNTVK